MGGNKWTDQTPQTSPLPNRPPGPGMVAECLAVPPTATWLPGAAGDGGSDDDGGEGVAEAREARCRAALEAAEGVARAALGLERAEAVARQRVAEAQRGRWLALTQVAAPPPPCPDVDALWAHDLSNVCWCMGACKYACAASCHF